MTTERSHGLSRLLIVGDCSDSMNSQMGTTSRIFGFKEASREAVRSMALLDSACEVGIGVFNSQFTRVAPLRSVRHNLEAIFSGLLRLRASGSTHFRCGLLGAAKMLRGAGSLGEGGLLRRLWGTVRGSLSAEEGNSSPSAFSVVTRTALLFLSDGHNNGPDPVPAAEALKEHGVEIHTVGIGNCPSEVDEWLLREIASLDPATGSPLYRFIHDADIQALTRHFTDVGTNLVCRV